MTISITPISQADYDEWIVAWVGYLTFYKTELTEKQHRHTFERLVDPNGNIEGLVAKDDGKIVGLSHFQFHPNTWTEFEYCYMSDLYVDPKCRGKGVGRKLIEATDDIAKARGCKRVYWTTAYDNKTAQALYDKVAITDRIQYKITH